MFSAFQDTALNFSTHGISQTLLGYFGVDVGQIFSTYILVYALYQLGRDHYSWLYDYILSCFTSCVEIDDWDILYNHLIDWASTHEMTKLSRELKAVTFDSASTPQTLCNHENTSNPCNGSDVTDLDGLFNFQKWYSNSPLVYKPNFSSKYFSYGGYWFHWSLHQRVATSGEGCDRVIALRCFGRSTKPIKNLLSIIKGFTLTQDNTKTEVYRSSVKSIASGHQWLRQSVRPSRPMHTVCLDQQQKTRIVQDINEYLQPATAFWYAERGIPYRRGYLFYGPPGTGKTSLSFALAGVFGLSIYCISLGERALTEADLATLFDNLPERCIVLLEDIDSAGVRRDADKVIRPVPDSSSNSGDDEGAGSPIETKDANSARGMISLAGLLNIIDGAASKEGRVLIMTTNYPKALDAALIRPGRVDLQIGFTLATQDQIREIYINMYKAKQNMKNQKEDDHPTACESDLPRYSHMERKDFVQPTEVENMAIQFACSIPSGVFSQAEIQGLLLKWRTDPEGALKDVGTWKVEQHKARKVGSKLIT